jgi:Outer membrane protein beta-barrel domain
VRKVLFFVLFLLAGRAADAQVLIALIFGETLNTGKIEFGLDGGLNLVTMDGINQAGNLTTWNLGFYFDIKLKDPSWLVHTGVIVKSSMGADHIPVYSLEDAELDSEFSGGHVTRKLSYFNVPVMIKYRFKGHLYVEGGLQLGLLHKASDEFTNTVPDGGDLSYKLDIKDQYHRLDAGAVAGIGYRLSRGNGINLGVRYYYGFADVAIDDTTPGQHNRSLYITVGIPIGAGKASKEGRK